MPQLERLTRKIQERWKSIDGYEGLYEVSEQGEVKSLDRTVASKWGTPKIVKGRTMVQKTTNNGRRQVCLSKDGKKLWVSVSRVVARSFIRNPHGLPCVNHRDNDPLNNKVENLEWCTYKENQAHMRRQGRQKYPCGERGGNTKLTWDQVCQIRNRKNEDQKLLAQEFGIKQSGVSQIINFKSWKKQR